MSPALVEQRNEKKQRQPRFIRQDAHKKKKLEKKWRRPKGYHNKMRRQVRGYRRIVKVGWGSPNNLRNSDSHGRRLVFVQTAKDLEDATKEDSLIISGRIGMRTRFVLLEEAKKRGIKVHNFDAEQYLKKVQAELQAKRQLKEEKLKEKKKKETTIEQAVEKEKPAEKAADELSEEEKKKKDKEEKDRVLTKRE